MILKPCPFCQKRIPRAITVCPYCHRNEQGQTIPTESSAGADTGSNGQYFENDLAELSSPDAFAREQAVVRVAQKGFGVVQALISILADHAKPGLAGVARALGRIRDRRAIGVLTQAAKMGDEELRTAAIWALTQFHEPEVLPTLLSEAERPHPTIQSYLAYVLGSYQDSRTLPVLTRLLHHPSREVAFQAACALGQTGDRHGVGALRKVLLRRDPVVREAAASSLRRLGSSAGRLPAILAYARWMLLPLVLGMAALGWKIYR